MLNIRDILSSLYANRSAEDLYIWLGKQGLLDSFKRIVSQLNAVVEDEETLLRDFRSLPVGHIAANLLWAVNRKIAAEGDPESAKEMENILSDICLQMLMSFLNKIKSDKTIVWLQITYALKDTCEFHNYDFNQLIQFLKIDAAASYMQSKRSAERVSLAPSIPSFCWKGKSEQLSDFLDIFSDQKLIKSRKGLAQLFGNPSAALQLQFDPGLADLVLQFFYTLKSRKLVTHTGCKGFYQALEVHIPDFKNKFLKNQEAGRRINALKQSRAKWSDNQRRIDSWLLSFDLWEPGFRTVLRT